MKKLICWLIGHDIDPCDCYAAECYRCGLQFVWHMPPRNDTWFWLTWWRIARLSGLSEFRGWLKCYYCGWRFGRHDPNNDHMPF